MHEGWAVRVRGDRIDAVGPAASVAAAGAHGRRSAGHDADARTHRRAFARAAPSRTTRRRWNDQVLHEALGVRVARATNHLRATLMAGFTTIRDLGTEGAGYADVELKQAVEQGIIPGPRMLVSTRAIVATGSYGPKGFALEWRVPQGAEEADGDSLVRVVRDQIGHGADWIKVYADYRWGARGEAAPTFSLEELKTDRRDGAQQRPAGRRALDDRRRHAPRGPGRRRDDRARRRRHAGGVQADEGAQRRALSDAGGRRRDGAVRGLEEGRSARARRRSRASAPASRRRSTPA